MTTTKLPAPTGDGTIRFEAFVVATGALATANEWDDTEADRKQLSAYRMRWLRGGTKWVRLTYPDGTVRQYGHPEVAARYPLAVVVDTVDGHVFRAGGDGELFTQVTATAFAVSRNADRKVGCGTYRVFKLVPVE